MVASAAMAPGTLGAQWHALASCAPRVLSSGGRSVWRPQGLAPLLTCCPSPQGLFVLLFHCVLNREVRKHLKGVFVGKKPHPDESATTRATLLTVGGTQGRPQGLAAGLHCSPGSVWLPGANISHVSTALVSLTKRPAQSHPQVMTSGLSWSQLCFSGSQEDRAQLAGTLTRNSGCGSEAGLWPPRGVGEALPLASSGPLCSVPGGGSARVACCGARATLCPLRPLLGT